MLIVTATPVGGQYVEFLRVDLVASDDGTTLPPTVAPFEILYTIDGSIPSDSNSETRVRRSPVRAIPVDGPLTIKYFARSITPPLVQTEIAVQFYDVLELTARNTIPTVGSAVRNYTLKIDDNGDLVRTSPGLYDVVFGVEKTKQDIREIVLVEDVEQNRPIGDRTLPRFGSALNRVLGSSFPIGFAANEIQSSLFNAMSFLIELQRQGRNPSDEQIRRVVSLSVSPIDPTTFRYHFVVETVSGSKVSESGTVLT